ncbi:MAG: hypothetical protein E4G94_00920 [ANME-2 cluster archaeon]|nr:MAG: hypothetical protein E4G94_00920 [ANME-2 cluster archaeon]
MIKQLIIATIATLLLASSASALMETRVDIIDIDTTVTQGDRVLITGKVSYADGSNITVGYMDYTGVEIWINGEVRTTYPNNHIKSYCDESGNFYAYKDIENLGANTVQVVFDGDEHSNLAGSESAMYIVEATPREDKHGSPASGLIRFIGYAKGLFALSFFGMLFLTIGSGSLAAATQDPEKKSAALDRMFMLLKILLTVTMFYLAMLFMAS